MSEGKNSFPILTVSVIALLIIITIFVGLGVAQLSYVGTHEATATEFQPVSYTDYVTILLSAISVILTILGMFLAILAIFGFSYLKNLTVTESRNRAEEVLKDEMETGGRIYELITHNLENNPDFREEVLEVIQRTYILPLDETDDGETNE